MWNLVELGSTWIQVNLVGMVGNMAGVQVKFGWVLIDIFLPNSDHSYHSIQIPAEYVGEGKVLVIRHNSLFGIYRQLLSYHLSLFSI